MAPRVFARTKRRRIRRSVRRSTWTPPGPRVRPTTMKSLMNPNMIFDHLCHVAPFTLSNNQIGSGLGSGYAFYFYLSTIYNAAEFTALYDTYRVKEIRWKLIPLASSNDMAGLDSGVNQAHLGAVYYTQDIDDSTVPTSVTDVVEYAGLKVKRYGEMFDLVCKNPHVNTVTEGSGIRSEVSPWLDCASASVYHRGFKMFISDCLVGTNTLYTVLMSVHIQFKGQR